jgi:hypothetical protein
VSNHIVREAGASRPASAALPRQCPAREGRGSSDATGANRPPPFPAEDQVVSSHPPHAFLSGRHQFPIALRGLGPRTACRRRTLETGEKVVTTSVVDSPSVGGGSTDRAHLRSDLYSSRQCGHFGTYPAQLPTEVMRLWRQSLYHGDIPTGL